MTTFNKITNKDLLQISGGNGLNNLSRQNFQNLVLENTENLQAPEYVHTNFVTDKYDIKLEIDDQLHIDSGRSITGIQPICVIDNKAIDKIQFQDYKIVVRKMSTISLDMNYKRYDTNLNLSNKGTLYRNQSLPILVKLYCNISDKVDCQEKLFDNIEHKMYRKLRKYFKLHLDYNAHKVFEHFMNRRNDSELNKHKARTPLKMYQLDGIDFKFKQVGSKKHTLTIEDFNINYDIVGSYYANTNLYVITAIINNLYDYTLTSDTYNRYILDRYHRLSENSKYYNRLDYEFFIHGDILNENVYSENYVQFIKKLFEQCIVITNLTKRENNGKKIYLIDLNKYPEFNIENTMLRLYDTRFIITSSNINTDGNVNKTDLSKLFMSKKIQVFDNNGRSEEIKMNLQIYRTKYTADELLIMREEEERRYHENLQWFRFRD